MPDRPSARTRELPVFPLLPDPVRPEVARDVQPVSHVVEPAGPYDGPRIALLTLGCDKNTVDSEHMMAALVGHGARVSGETDGADVVIVNTCGFIQSAKEESIEAILEACHLKETMEARAVVAVGCLVQRYKDELRAEIPEVDLFLGLTELDRLIPELRVRGLLPLEAPIISTMERPLRLLSTSTPHTSYLKISEGCDHSCAFCAIPLMRGLHRSAPLDEVLREARELEGRGVREINIVSQDTTWYGRDLRRRHGREGAPSLTHLLRALLDGTQVPWYRLFYMYPSGIDRDLVDLVASEPRVLPYLDMPVQHGSDRILEAMRRPERQRTIRKKVAWLREAIPGLTLRTTVIVGFPGETEEDFRGLLEFVEEMRFERLGAFPYSREEGTRAAEMEGHLPQSLVRERLEELLDLQRDISLEANQRWVGTRTTLLVDERLDDGSEFAAVGRTVGQALDVDGVSHVLAPSTVDPGAMVEVEVADALEYDLIVRAAE